MARSVVHEPRFTEELARIEPDAWRADKCISGAEFLLAHNPRAGHKISENVWFLACFADVGYPGLVIYYTFDEHRVYFLSVRLDPPPN